MFAHTSSKISTHILKLLNFTFMLPYIVIDFFLNNQTDVLIIQFFLFSTVHSTLVCQDGTRSLLTLLANGHQNLRETYQ